MENKKPYIVQTTDDGDNCARCNLPIKRVMKNKRGGGKRQIGAIKLGGMVRVGIFMRTVYL